jgi:hypothetical protein
MAARDPAARGPPLKSDPPTEENELQEPSNVFVECAVSFKRRTTHTQPADKWKMEKKTNERPKANLFEGQKRAANVVASLFTAPAERRRSIYRQRDN